MPAPYPKEFRREAVELLKRSGKSIPQLASELGVSDVASTFNVSRSTLYRAIR